MDNYGTTAKKTSGDFEKIPPGLHQAVCVGVYGLGLQKIIWKEEIKIQPKVRLVWELKKKDSNGNPFFLSKTYTLSLGDKANLFKDLKDWRGKAFTAEELEAFEVKNVEGANCMLNIIHEGDYANISSIAMLMSELSPIKKSMDIPQGMLNKIEEKRKEAIQEEVVTETAAVDKITEEFAGKEVGNEFVEEHNGIDDDPPLEEVPF